MRNRRHRFQHQSEVDAEGSWAISYGDMVTLLLTFFIIFFTADKFKTKSSSSLDLQAFRTMSEKATREIASAVSPSSATVLPPEKMIDEVSGKAYQIGKRIIVEFNGISFFASGDTEVNAIGKAALTKFFEAYQPYMGHYVLSLRAFTDTKKVKASSRKFKDNLELSALRSISVMRHLHKQGIPLANMKLAGYGEMKLSETDISKKIEFNLRKPSSTHDLARTTILVIEPREER